MRRLLFLIVFTGALVAGAGEPPTVQSLDGAEFSGVLARAGRVLIAGQPTEAGLAALASEGVKTVINLRIPQEMNALGFDEPMEAKRLGMDYVALPSGGPEHPFSKETLGAFASALESADGDVLLHCRSATRASHLWVAYLVKYQQMSMEEALAQGRAIHFGSTPIEGYLEGEIEYQFKPAVE